MAIRYRYTRDELLFLKDSPLVVKPANLPPTEQWMGAPPEPGRTATKSTELRGARSEVANNLQETPNRRPGVERHMSRNSANPEDVILGPPKTSFISASSIRNPIKVFESTERPPLSSSDSRDRFSFRSKPSEGDSDRPRDSRNTTLRPKRADGEDSDGWSTVKPRKSFGTEGAERFNGRMGVVHREERRFKDRDERDVKEKPRGFDTFTRDRVEKDIDQDQERENRRNGTGRGRNEPSWFKDRDSIDQPPTPRDRNSNGDRMAERSRGWREKDHNDRNDRNDRGGDRPERGGGGGDRGDRGDRRWDRDRDQRQEREPEWMEAPAEEKSKAHTQEEFEKWKEQMQGKDKPTKTPAEEPAPQPDTGSSFFELEPKKKAEIPLAIDLGPDKFFGNWATPKDENPPDLTVQSTKEGTAKAKPSGKSSRFTSFFAPQEEPLRQQTAPPPVSAPVSAPDGLAALFGAPSQPAQASQGQGGQGQADHEAFQQLLAKLKSHPPAATPLPTPPVNDFQQRKPPVMENPHSNTAAPDTFQQYRQERLEESRPHARNTQQAQQEYVAQRSMAGSQTAMRQDQMLQDLLTQRQNAASQGSTRPDQSRSGKNTEFLMNLMQSAEAAPHPQPSERVLLGMQNNGLDRMQQLQQQRLLEQEHHARRENMMREQVAARERAAAQRQIPTQPPPGFYEDPALFQRGPMQHERHVAPQSTQPTAILRRPAERPTQNPPGLDLGWERNAQLQAQLHAQHRLAQGPPPGLVGGRGGMPMPHYPPGFAMNEFPPPNMMNGPTGPSGPPRNMPPPGFFNNGGPPGFLPQGMPGFQDMPFGPAFDGRGPPPQGAYRRQ